MHSDVTGLPLRVTSSDACLLGAAVLASVGAGAHASIKQAVTAMVKVLHNRTVYINCTVILDSIGMLCVRTVSQLAMLYANVHSQSHNCVLKYFHAYRWSVLYYQIWLHMLNIRKY
jgi:hypothetical protein